MRFAFSASTIFLAAFLLFQVQPLIAGYILPWFGGSGAVWTTAMLFFQVVLVLGYAYAHWSITRLAPRTQAALHVSLLVAAVALLPIVPSPDWKPEASVDPTWRILLLLGATVGLPFLLLASTSPLLQAWLHRARPGVAPYRLYALGNAASLLALLTYPFVFEPLFSRQGRATFWSWGFGLFAAAGTLCALEAWRRAGAAPGRSVEARESALASASRSGRSPDRAAWLAPVAWTSRILLLLLPATASLLMLAITQQISQDVAPIPFLWVLPLGLYLFSFVLVFERDRWYRRGVFLGALVPAMGVALVLLFLAGNAPMWGQIGGWSLVLLVCCIACHGEAARLKPQPEGLTGYYLTIACGGHSAACSLRSWHRSCSTPSWSYMSDSGSAARSASRRSSAKIAPAGACDAGALRGPRSRSADWCSPWGSGSTSDASETRSSRPRGAFTAYCA